MKINTAFLKILESYDIDINVALNAKLDADLANILGAGFYKDQDTGCVFFKEREQNIYTNLYSELPDFTGVECFINDIAIDEYADDSREIIKQGLSLTNHLSINLNKNYENQFLTVLTYDSGIDTGFESCTVRFHTIRENESWLDDDIESYDQGVLTL